MDTLKKNSKPNFNQVKEIVRNLSPSQKLKLNDFIWQENIEIPDEHKILVRQRKEKALKSPERVVNWETAINILNQ